MVFHAFTQLLVSKALCISRQLVFGLQIAFGKNAQIGLQHLARASVLGITHQFQTKSRNLAVQK